jgi:signal transduction histidine kinase
VRSRGAAAISKQPQNIHFEHFENDKSSGCGTVRACLKILMQIKPGAIFRLVVFFATIATLMALIAWTAQVAWEKTGELHEQLSETQWKSFQIADHLQQTVLGLNNKVLRYAAYQDQSDWTNFFASSQQLGDWLKQQRPILSETKERPLLDKIIVAYGNYMAAATALNSKIYATHQSITRVVEFTDLENQSQVILDLSIRLSEAHQESSNTLQAQSFRSLGVLRYTLLGALAVLLLVVCWVGLVVYREMIEPLQVQLVESRQMAQQQEKLASLGMLAAGVAHEIRNPLTAIKAWLYLQQKHLTPGSPEYSDAQIIGGEINRLERIVKEFLQFARPAEPKWEVMPAEQPSLEVQRLLEPELGKHMVRIVLGKIEPALVRIDPQQIKQVLINLVHNAADAIGEDGTVTLSVRVDEKRINDRLLDVVILEVTDTGKGISPEAEKRLFDPFFTTKDTGTGLGLPIAARIVEKHGGALQYQTQEGHGTTFGIILPLHIS